MVFRPDIDDDNDGIPDYVELNNPVAFAGCQQQWYSNWNDATYPGFTDNNADGLMITLIRVQIQITMAFLTFTMLTFPDILIQMEMV